MPPFGLYPIPRHHLYDQSPHKQRRTFNSMDFADEEPLPNKDKAKLAAARAQRKLEKHERKEKKRKEKELLEQQKTKELKPGERKQRFPPVDSILATSSKSISHRKRDEALQSTSTTATKRKRESDTNADVSDAINRDVNIDKLLIDPNFLSGLKTTMGNMGAVFSEHAKNTESPTEAPPKKRGRPLGWRKSTAMEQASADGTNVQAATNLAFEQAKSKTHVSEEDGASCSTLKKPVKTTVPVPSTTSAARFSIKKTPVPLPKQPNHKAADSVSEPSRGKTKEVRPDSEVLVTETPPSSKWQAPATTPRQPAIPFRLSKTSNPPSTQSKRSKRPTVDISPPEQPKFALSKLSKAEKHVIGSQGSVDPLTSSQADTFTASTLLSYKQKLNHTPKPRPRRCSRVTSEAASTASNSSSASISIRDMLARIPKPYSRAADPSTPSPFFTTYQQSKSKETTEEASARTFTPAFLTLQSTINFPLELSHLASHDAHIAATTACAPLPCLRKATGCSPRNELLLRHNLTTLLPSISASDLAFSAAAITHAQQAVTFLRHALAARIPVPLGQVEGVWRLYCPGYSGLHVDKYGYGHRSLTIYRAASSSSFSTSEGGLFTASLSIPPRSLAYSLQPFKVPPHASFRAVGLKTQDEGYEVKVVFLGNGYLKVWVNVHLLLLGRRAVEAVGVAGVGKGGEKAGEKSVGAGKGKAAEVKANEVFGIWEFLGIHERAIVWG